jgi:hypothetical protein
MRLACLIRQFMVLIATYNTTQLTLCAIISGSHYIKPLYYSGFCGVSGWLKRVYMFGTQMTQMPFPVSCAHIVVIFSSPQLYPQIPTFLALFLRKNPFQNALRVTKHAPVRYLRPQLVCIAQHPLTRPSCTSLFRTPPKGVLPGASPSHKWSRAIPILPHRSPRKPRQRRCPRLLRRTTRWRRFAIAQFHSPAPQHR